MKRLLSLELKLLVMMMSWVFVPKVSGDNWFPPAGFSLMRNRHYKKFVLLGFLKKIVPFLIVDCHHHSIGSAPYMGVGKTPTCTIGNNKIAVFKC